jgi:hypothetical protein
MTRVARLDAPFWALLLVGLFSVGSLGCFVIAEAAQVSHGRADILTTDNFPPPTGL